ncbi:helix-turn-helix transcriptional regulator [Chloroflexota bacterium]
MNVGSLTMTIPQVAGALGISRALAYELAKRGELPGTIKLGKKRLVVSRIAIERLLQCNGDETKQERL